MGLFSCQPEIAKEDLPNSLTLCSLGDLKKLKYLKKIGLLDVDVRDEYGATCLHYAARSNQVDTLKFLIKKCHVPYNVQAKNGATILHDAAANGHLEALKWLLRYTKLTLKEKDNDGGTILHIASRY